MLDNDEEFKSLVHTVSEICKAQQLDILVDFFSSAAITIEQTNYDNWNGGTYCHSIYFVIDIKLYLKLGEDISSIENLLLEKFLSVTRHFQNDRIDNITIIPKAYNVAQPSPNPNRQFTNAETKKREELVGYLNNASEDELIENILIPLFRQLGFHKITPAGHKDKLLEYGKDIWMKFTLPTQHIIYFGIQVKKGKLDSSGISKNGNGNIAEIYNQLLMMIGHEIFDPEIGKKVLVDHAFIVAGGEITKQAKNWIGGKLDVTKRNQIMFMDRDDILNLYVVNNLPLPSSAIKNIIPIDDGLPF
jgi:hypothetical protein